MRRPNLRKYSAFAAECMAWHGIAASLCAGSYGVLNIGFVAMLCDVLDWWPVIVLPKFCGSSCFLGLGNIVLCC